MTQINQLLEIMAKLRNPNGGCPWDLEQNFATIAPYTIEEAYEVADAIAKGDMDELKAEGDRMVGDDIAEEGLRYLQAINFKDRASAEVLIAAE